MKNNRILAVWLSSPGFGYALMEGNQLVKYGHRRIDGDKNRKCAKHVEKLLIRNTPDVLVLPDVRAKGTYRAPRILKLHEMIVSAARRHKVKTVKVSNEEMRNRLLGDKKGTRHQMAERIAKEFPDELNARLPAKRKAWEGYNPRIDLFMAVGLVVASLAGRK
jgi:hypothetical protein